MKAAMRSRKEIAEEFALALEFHRARIRENSRIAARRREEKCREMAGASLLVVPARHRAFDAMDFK